MGEKKIYEVFVSERARDMLLCHVQFLAQVSISAADKLFDLFEEKVASLEEMPERCPLYINPYIRAGKYRKIDLGNYWLILFQIKGRKVFIDLVIDTRAQNVNLW